MTAGQLRETIQGLKDDESVPIEIEYGDVVDSVFVRLDQATAREGIIALILSLVTADEVEDGD